MNNAPLVSGSNDLKPDINASSEIASIPEVPALRIVRRLISGLGEGGVLLLLTCVSYGLAYCYKLGHYRAFDLPTFLVSIDIHDSLRAGGAILSGGITLFLFLNLPFVVVNFVRFKRAGWRYLIAAFAFVFSLFSVLNALFDVSWTTFWIGFAIMSVILLSIFGLAALIIKFQSRSDANSHEYNDLLDWLRQMVGREVFILLLMLPAIGFLVEKLGYSNARKQKDFSQLTNTKLVLIDSTPHGLLCKTLNENGAHFDNGFTLLSGDEVSKLTFGKLALPTWGEAKSPSTNQNVVDENQNDSAQPATPAQPSSGSKQNSEPSKSIRPNESTELEDGLRSTADPKSNALDGSVK